ncbi:MAG: transcription-repair coupling factor, partial [Methylococcales bacterium]|nr:transcription-repair coupling factor [Methylococcales bacterium]
MLVASLDEGVELLESQVALIVEAQLFGEQPVPQRKLTQKLLDPELMIRDLVELNPNAPVVHLDYGIGRYLGLKTIHAQGFAQEFIELLYAGGDKIYLPVTALNRISRYTGSDPETAPLHKLGAQSWQQEKQKAIEKIHDVAVELLEIYAKRKAQPGTAFSVDEAEYAQFASRFPFTETEDQRRAIEDILHDLKQPTPMDRLICGDVGFGKTEVAMRAAFVAVHNAKQVCILVPTTLLAAQHFETFRDRFAAFPVQIALLSRFKSAKESEKVIAGLKQGSIDIVIGTHKLFSRDLPFKNLGLLVIDEEHRFGVKQKEHLKALRHEVHCLSMTATPIPRTLNMAMAGLRDVSLIATAPLKRLAIKTFWREHNVPLIREAILREILRGGQVFYLHNKVENIERVTQDIQALVPEAKIHFAHGQMSERSLERLMTDFYHQRFNVLVCTTIIETGIDIPTANTMIIDRADLFGLAQLHQLRGRVGRSHHQAYAYLLTPPEKTLSADAVKRLEAIVSLEELGSGFILASHDLEIRGAGELLGEEQSGNMHAIGFSLYMELLERAVKDLRSGKKPELLQPIHQGP